MDDMGFLSTVVVKYHIVSMQNLKNVVHITLKIAGETFGLFQCALLDREKLGSKVHIHTQSLRE